MQNISIYAFADEAGAAVSAQIAALSRNGLKGVELRNVEGTNIADLTAAQAKELRKKLDDAGMIAWSIGSPIGKFDIEDNGFAAHADRLRNALDTANILGAKKLRMFSFFMPEGKDPALFQSKVMDRLGEFIRIADDSGVMLCHENEKGIYGDTALRCLDIHRTFPQLGGVFDPCNFVQCGEDTVKAWELLKPFICYMHIKDGLADGSVVPAGRGIGNLRHIVSDYVAMGGRDFTIEPHLASFEGLSQLERDQQKSRVGLEYIYENSNQAFDAACEAFKELLLEVFK